MSDILAGISEGGPFSKATVVEIARALAKADYVPPPAELPDPIRDLTYEQYRDIWANHRRAIWDKADHPFRLEMFHRGFYYKEEVEVALVADGAVEHLSYSPKYFIFGDRVPKPMPTEDIGFAGIRLSGRLGKANRIAEFLVFLGATYFRSRGGDQHYGLSARGLALRTAAAEGEEFPLFRAFWVEEPVADADTVVVHALLDSPSVAGAYRFTVRPGASTAMDVEVVLFPRVTLDKVGLAPGTSMYFFSANRRENVDDWRPEVHDSDGLLIVNGRGERIWRPLANPRTLQVSSFMDAAPQGFGLMQRNRDPESYQDFEAHYQDRPSLWTEPVGNWGEGAVVLVEIPSDSEINDNIVAYWQPKQPIEAGSEFSFAYRLFWGGEPSVSRSSATVEATRSGRASLQGDSPVRRFVIDFRAQPPTVIGPPPMPAATVSASAGAINGVTVQRNPQSGGWRLTFELDPQGADSVELRAVMKVGNTPAAETWLYRWTS